MTGTSRTGTSRTGTSGSGTSEMSGAEFDAMLQTFVGQEVGGGQPAPDAVNIPMVRHWCEAIGDENPVYLDAEAAAASVHGELVAPPTMLQAWVMSGIRGPQRDPESPYEQMNQLLFSRGFTSVVATNCEQTYHRYLHPGDQLTMRTVIDSISPQKTTGLGTGHFITTRQDYYDGAGELVGSMLFRIIRFRPAAKAATPPARPLRPEAATTLDNHWWFQALAAGELRVQRCADCNTLRHPPGPMCPSCHSLSWDSVPAPTSGTIHSFVVVHYPVVASFDYPLPVVLVDLDGMPGIRIVMNTADSTLEQLEIGARVHIEVHDADDPTAADGVRLPFAIVEPTS
jgi:uncharacterized OB-fold protein/acyl dehydratase